MSSHIKTETMSSFGGLLQRHLEGFRREQIQELEDESTVAYEQDNIDDQLQAKAVVVDNGFCSSHPREMRRAQRENRGKSQEESKQENITDDLVAAVTKFEEHVPLTDCAQRDWDRVQEAVQSLAIKLKPPKTLHAQAKFCLHDKIPATLRQPWPNRRLFLHKATYEANDPTEDRSTIVVGDSFLFAGVWDGHGGYQCSEYTQNTVFETFAEQYSELAKGDGDISIPLAFIKAFQKVNVDYYHHARAENEEQAYFAGTCACACFVDFNESGDATLYCANLGDSRAVMGILQKNGSFESKPLSVDHTADNLLERQRIQALHPQDRYVVINMTADSENKSLSTSGHSELTIPFEPPDWRVKGIAAFTRSIGDLQLKEKNTAALFNSYLPPANRILPRPGIVGKDKVPTKPYISTDAEVQQLNIPDPKKNPSFVIIASDGVWDELDSDDAVEIVGDLLSQYPTKDVNIADLFIEKVLEQVVERLRETDDYEANLTLKELKRRPKGKRTDGSRSLLHDDITVVILQLGSSKTFYRGRRGRSGRNLGNRTGSLASMKSLQKALLRQRGSHMSHQMQAIQERMKQQDPERMKVDRQILGMMDFFEGMNLRHLKILFNALDVDGNGTLDRDEIGRLISQVMLTDVSPTVSDMAFEEMDADHSGAVDFQEFVAFFGHHDEDHLSKQSEFASNRMFSRRASQ